MLTPKQTRKFFSSISSILLFGAGNALVEIDMLSRLNQVHAQSLTSTLQFVDLSGAGIPSEGRGQASSRGDCPSNLKTEDFQVILPEFYELQTHKRQPTLWFLNPYGDNQLHSFQVEIYNPKSTGEQDYKVTILASEVDAGIIGVTPPFQWSPNAGSQYSWKLSVNCYDPNIYQDERPIVLKQNVYFRTSQARTWYDTLSEIGQKRCLNTRNSTLKSQWDRLLTIPTINLSELTQYPNIQCFRN